MKKSFYALGIFILIASGQTSGQTTETSFNAESRIIHNPLAKHKAGAEEFVNVSSAVLDRFHKDYNDAKDITWVEVPNGYRAYFVQDAISTAVDYTRKGSLYSVIRYGKHLLTTKIKSLLENAFDDIQIREVAEVKIAEFQSRAYIVVLQDRTSLKTIQIIEGEISIIQEVSK